MKKHKSLVLIKVAIFNISSNCVNASFAVKPFSYFLIADKPSGYDRVRNVEIGNKDFELDVLDEAYTTEHWIVRIYKVGSARPGLSVYLVLYVNKITLQRALRRGLGFYEMRKLSFCFFLSLYAHLYLVSKILYGRASLRSEFFGVIHTASKVHHMQGHRREKLYPSLQRQSHCDV